RPGTGFFLDDGTGVMYVEPLAPLGVPVPGERLEHEPQTWLQPGELVEVIGVRHNWYSLAPSLLQAEYRRLGHAPPVQPVKVTVEDLMAGRYAGRLVTLEARLLDQRQWRNLRLSYQALVFGADENVFLARWESETPARWDLKL